MLKSSLAKLFAPLNTNDIPDNLATVFRKERPYDDPNFGFAMHDTSDVVDLTSSSSDSELDPTHSSFDLEHLGEIQARLSIRTPQQDSIVANMLETRLADQQYA